MNEENKFTLLSGESIEFDFGDKTIVLSHSYLWRILYLNDIFAPMDVTDKLIGVRVNQVEKLK